MLHRLGLVYMPVGNNSWGTNTDGINELGRVKQVNEEVIGSEQIIT